MLKIKCLYDCVINNKWTELIIDIFIVFIQKLSGWTARLISRPRFGGRIEWQTPAAWRTSSLPTLGRHWSSAPSWARAALSRKTSLRRLNFVLGHAMSIETLAHVILWYIITWWLDIKRCAAVPRTMLWALHGSQEVTALSLCAY